MLVALLFAPRVTREMRDFEVYWTAASRAVAAEPLYRAEDGHYQFKYLPAFAISAAPLAALSLPVAKTVWFAISVVLVIALMALSLRLIEPRRRPAWLLVVVIVVAMGKFFAHELILGQVNLLFAVLVVGAVLALRRQRGGLAGALMVASVVVKPYGIVFLPWLAVRGTWKTAASAAAASLYVAGAPVVLYGVDRTLALHRDWWATITGSTAATLTNPDNVSVAGLTAKWFGATVFPAALMSAGLLAIASVVIVRGRGMKAREALEGALLLTLVPLLSPQGWDYVFLVATPAIAILANHDDRLPAMLRVLTWVAIGSIGLSIYDLLGRQLYARFMELSILTLCFFVVIAALATLRLRRVA